MTSFMALGFLACGAVFVLAGLWWAFRTLLYLRGAARATGTVVLQEEADPDGQTRSYKAVVFHDAGGEAREAFMLAGLDRLAEGEKVPVLYEPGDPETARVPSFVLLWLPGLLAFGVGAGSITVGVALLLVGR